MEMEMEMEMIMINTAKNEPNYHKLSNKQSYPQKPFINHVSNDNVWVKTNKYQGKEGKLLNANKKLTQWEVNKISSHSHCSSTRGSTRYTCMRCRVGGCTIMLIFSTDTEKKTYQKQFTLFKSKQQLEWEWLER